MSDAQPLAVSLGARVVVVVTPGCHLCDTACAVVAEVCADGTADWCSVELAELDESWQQQWRNYVPVVLVDGKVHDFFRVDAVRLRAALRSPC